MSLPISMSVQTLWLDMECQEIETVLRNLPTTKNIFRGCFVSDKLLLARRVLCRGQDNIFIVLIVDEEDDFLGHFILLYLSSDNILTVFDSVGRHYPKINDFLAHLRPKLIHRNVKKIQGPNSCVCGVYCILVAVYLSIGLGLTHIIQWFSKSDLKTNDESVYLWFTKRIAKHFVTRRQRLLMCQI